MIPNKNIIRKQALHFNYTGNEDGLAIQKEVAQWCMASLNPAIEKVLSEYEQTDEIIQIDALEIPVDIANTETWQSVLNEKIIQALKEKMQSAVSSNANDVLVKKVTAVFSEALAYFLLHGLLPWKTTINSKKEFETVLSKWLINITEKEALSFAGIFKNTNAAKRFSNLLNEEQFQIFANHFSVNSEILMADARIISSSIRGTIEIKNIFFNRLKEILISYSSELKDDVLINAVAAKWLHNIIF